MDPNASTSTAATPAIAVTTVTAVTTATAVTTTASVTMAGGSSTMTVTASGSTPPKTETSGSGKMTPMVATSVQGNPNGNPYYVHPQLMWAMMQQQPGLQMNTFPIPPTFKTVFGGLTQLQTPTPTQNGVYGVESVATGRGPPPTAPPVFQTGENSEALPEGLAGFLSKSDSKYYQSVNYSKALPHCKPFDGSSSLRDWIDLIDNLQANFQLDNGATGSLAKSCLEGEAKRYEKALMPYEYPNNFLWRDQPAQGEPGSPGYVPPVTGTLMPALWARFGERVSPAECKRKFDKAIPQKAKESFAAYVDRVKIAARRYVEATYGVHGSNLAAKDPTIMGTMFNSEMICGLWSGMLQPYKDHLEDRRDTFVLFDQIRSAAEAFELTEKGLRLLKLSGSQWSREAAPVQIGEAPDRIVAAVPPKRQGKRQKAARSGAGDTNRRSSDVGWTGNDFVRKPDGQTGCGFCGMSGPSHPASKCRALQKLKLEGKPIPSRHPGFPLLTFKQKEANRGSAMADDGAQANVAFASAADIPPDMVRVSSPSRYPCVICPRILRSPKGLRDHLASKHDRKGETDELRAKLKKEMPEDGRKVLRSFIYEAVQGQLELLKEIGEEATLTKEQDIENPEPPTKKKRGRHRYSSQSSSASSSSSSSSGSSSSSSSESSAAPESKDPKTAGIEESTLDPQPTPSPNRKIETALEQEGSGSPKNCGGPVDTRCSSELECQAAMALEGSKEVPSGKAQVAKPAMVTTDAKVPVIPGTRTEAPMSGGVQQQQAIPLFRWENLSPPYAACPPRPTKDLPGAAELFGPKPKETAASQAMDPRRNPTLRLRKLPAKQVGSDKEVIPDTNRTPFGSHFRCIHCPRQFDTLMEMTGHEVVTHGTMSENLTPFELSNILKNRDRYTVNKHKHNYE